MKNISNLFVRLFVISLLTFRYFSVIVSLFGAGAATIFTAPAPAPAPSKPFRRLRLRLRLRPKCVGSGGSGSGSGSASLVWPYFSVYHRNWRPRYLSLCIPHITTRVWKLKFWCRKLLFYFCLNPYYDQPDTLLAQRENDKKGPFRAWKKDVPFPCMECQL